MGIRLKLLILLLLISLIPLLAVGIGIKRDLARLRKNRGRVGSWLHVSP